MGKRVVEVLDSIFLETSTYFSIFFSNKKDTLCRALFYIFNMFYRDFLIFT